MKLARNLRFTGILAASSISYGIANVNTKKSYCDGDEPTARTPSVTLYKYKICPFCNRVKTYLDYLQIPYTTVEVNPITKSELKFSKDYKKVPVAVIDDKVIGNSPEIIAHFTAMSVADESKQALLEEFFPEDASKWMEWSEKRLAVMLYPNITRSMNESWECFAYTNDVESWSAPERMVTRAVGAAFMSLANGKIKKKYNIVDERKELQAVLAEWTNAIDPNGFLHGEKLTMPDLMVYGVLQAIEGFQTFNEIMAENELLRSWYGRVHLTLQEQETTGETK